MHISKHLLKLAFLTLILGIFGSAHAANTTVNNGVTSFFWGGQILVSVQSPLAGKSSQAPSAGLYCPGVSPVGYAAAGQSSSVINYLLPTNYASMGCAIQVVSGNTYDTHYFTMPNSAVGSQADEFTNVPGYDIIIIGGQSNASNSGVGAFTDPLAGVLDNQIFQATCDDANGDYILDNGETSEIVNKFDYVHDCFSGIAANANYISTTGRMGFAISFARQYSMRNLTKGRKTLIIAGGVPGSGSPAWITGPTAYLPNLLARVQTALALPGKNRVVAFAWSQGEAEIGAVGDALASGAYNQTQYQQYVQDYANRVLQVISTTRSTLNLPKLPFLISQHAPEWTAYENVKTNFEAVDQWIASYAGNAAWVSASGLKSNPLCTGALVGTFNCEDAAQIHFSAQSHTDMGARFFQSLQNLTSAN